MSESVEAHPLNWEQSWIHGNSPTILGIKMDADYKIFTRYTCFSSEV